MLLPLKDMAGTQLGELEVSDAAFAAPVSNSLMHQALVRQLANARQGNHSTKTRGEVRGGGQKPWRQKGTGRARQGSRRSPNWVGGGTVFGPRPRTYTQSMPRKMRRAALRSALTVKTADEQVVVVDGFNMDSPQTKVMLSALDALGANGQSVLIVLAEKDENIQRSARNLPKVKTLLGDYLNIRDLLGHDMILVSKDAVEQIDLWLSSGMEVDEVVVAEVVADEVVETAAVVEETADGETVVAEVAADAVEPDEVVVVEAADGETIVAESVTDEAPTIEASSDETSSDEVATSEETED